MTLTTIEKAAKLMGLKYHRVFEEGLETEFSYEDYVGDNSSRREWFDLFNPYTNKADLVDLETAISEKYFVRVYSAPKFFRMQVESTPNAELIADSLVLFSDHPDKFTARAHAVMDVVSQIYDRRKR